VPVRPVAAGLHLCELAIIDQKTQKVSAVSCFSRRVIDGGVEFMPPFYVVATLANGHGTMPAQLVIERLDTMEVTYERRVSLSFANSLQEVTAVIRVRGNAIPVHGYYHALLIVDGEQIAQKRFSIFRKESNP
jgi:hypothetical protein